VLTQVVELGENVKLLEMELNADLFSNADANALDIAV
jgi:hypothetical protein